MVRSDGLRIWQGEHDGYRRLSDPVRHTRIVMALGDDRWLVVDKLAAAQVHCYDLQWLLADLPYKVVERQDGFEIKLDVGGKSLRMVLRLEWKRDFSVVRGAEDSTRGWRSRYYGEKHPALSVMLSTRAANATLLDVGCARGEWGSVTGRD